jgi:ABC-type lipoprotein release transport system permease subunit
MEYIPQPRTVMVYPEDNPLAIFWSRSVSVCMFALGFLCLCATAIPLARASLDQGFEIV